jgi:hypothetical protein
MSRRSSADPAAVARRKRACDALPMKGDKKGGVEPLTRVSMFGGLRNDTLTFLLARAETVSVAEGDVFFREGEPGGALYVLRRGRAQVIKHKPATRSKKAKSIQVAEIKAGGCFGEVSLLAVMPRSATVAALEDCEALRLRYTGPPRALPPRRRRVRAADVEPRPRGRAPALESRSDARRLRRSAPLNGGFRVHGEATGPVRRNRRQAPL